LKAAGRVKIGLVAALAVFGFRGPAASGMITILPDVAVSGVQPFGVNLGFRTSWGAEQLVSNVIMNPGFEGIVDRSLVAAVPLDPYRFLDQSKWLGRQDQFWAGAEFQVRTGISAGYTGKIVTSKKTGATGFPEFSALEELPPLEPGDRIALTKVTDELLPTQWWIPADSAAQFAVSKDRRPGSPGVRSLEFRPRPNSAVEIHSYLDRIGDRAGILLPVVGKWRLSFWARSAAGARLTVRLERSGGHVWVDRTIPVSPQWRREAIEFEGGEDSATGGLDLRFGAQANLLLDDVELVNTGSQAGFRQETVAALETLRPAYLRDWQGQLGDTLENRLATATGRRPSRYRPGGNEATDFGYGLPEFLDLCRQIHAKPWIVAPTTFGDAEWAGLGRYLASRAAEDRFSEILVEFGNENWNRLFEAAGITDNARHADAAARGFQKLKEAAGGLPVRAVVNAQYANPDSAADLANRLPLPAVLAVAPYFLTELKAAQNSTESLSLLFAPDHGKLQRIAGGLHGPRQELGVYEINLHTTGGDAPGATRTGIVGGAASGSALAMHLLQGLALGARRQCAYVLSGFDYQLPGKSGFAPLFGIVRDLGPTRRFRPTGLALSMINQAVAGDLHKSSAGLADLTVAPFRSPAGWSVVLASASAESRELRLEFPATNGAMPTRCLQLRAADPLATNETDEQVTLTQESVAPVNRIITLRLPAYGLAVLLPEETHDR
jgi:hypothetical protein